MAKRLGNAQAFRRFDKDGSGEMATSRVICWDEKGAESSLLDAFGGFWCEDTLRFEKSRACQASWKQPSASRCARTWGPEPYLTSLTLLQVGLGRMEPYGSRQGGAVGLHSHQLMRHVM